MARTADTNAARPMARADLAVVELDGETVIYDETSGELHHLNRSASIVFTLCDGVGTVDDIAADLAAVFRVPLEDLRGDIAELVAKLEDSHLLEGHASPDAG